MPKTYINKMIVGNSAVLGCIDERGELVRLFWPDIDYPQHVDRLLVGVASPQIRRETLWLSSENWRIRQFYLEDTNIAVTEYDREEFGLKITQSDFALPEKPVLERLYEVENRTGSPVEVGFVLFSSSVSTTPNPACTLYEPNLSALVHYKHDYYYSIASGTEAVGYQLGGNSLQDAEQGELKGNDVIGMMKEGAMLWEKKTLPAGGKLRFALHICLSRDLKSLKRLAREMEGSDPSVALEQTAAWWRNYLNGLRRVDTGNPGIDGLYRRSLLVFALMTNKRTGALLAAPETDEEFTRCGRYAYCWGRDAAFITAALDKAGMHADVEHFYRWAAEIQEEDGSWQQRYHMDGNLAPSWGLQIDETGTILHGVWKHYEECGDQGFLSEMWPCVKKGVGFLEQYADAETGLPWLSFDLWEERLGEHAYSTAAVIAGMEAGAKIAGILAAGAAVPAIHDDTCSTSGAINANNADEMDRLGSQWSNAAARMKDALEKNFWKPEWNRFVRSIRVKLNAWGDEPTDAKCRLRLNDKSISRDFSLLDGTVDISLLGLSIPFGVYDALDPRMESTAEVVELVLSGRPAGGLMRYEYDGYIGGNPWIIATLWAALYHIGKKSFDKAREYFHWSLKGITEQGLLPEQVDKETGKPAWVIPLTWSHAMFVLVLDALLAAGEL